MNPCLPLLFALLPAVAEAAWVDSTGKPLPETESMRSAGDLGVQIVLTADEKAFRKTWNASKSTPRLKSTNRVRVGGSVSAMLIFHGCAANPAGYCELVSDFSIEAPDGSRIPAGGGPVWTDKPMPLRLLQLGQASLTVGFDPTDRAGDYKLIARVSDKVAGTALEVVARLKLTP